MTEVQGTTTLFGESLILNDDGTRASSTEAQLQADNSTVVTTNTTWGYDAMDRLMSEAVTSSISAQSYTDAFGYDLSSNQITDIHTGSVAGTPDTTTNTYSNDDEQLTSTINSVETIYGYDANGSQLTATTGSNVITYTYDVRNKMVKYAVNGVTKASYRYDDAGNRVQETGSGTTAFYLTDTQNPTGYAQPLEQRASSTSAPVLSYIIGDQIIAQSDSSGNVSYLLIDGHGSTQQMTSSTGNITAAFRYGAVGFAINFTPPTSIVPANAATAILFGGDAIYDPISGLYMHGDGTRDRIGFQFLQADTQGNGSNGDPISLHKYLYANANPISYDDPTGHDGELTSLLTTIGGIAGLIAAYAIPIVEAASPYLTALALVTFATDPEAAEQFIATGGNPEALVADLVNVPGLIADDAESLLVFGRGLLQDAKALGVGGAEVNALRGAVSNAAGTFFEEAVTEALGPTETNAQAYSGATRNGPVNSVPDLPVGPQYGVTEIKSSVSVTNTPQLQSEASVAKENDNLPFNLIISPDTKSISGPVIRAIDNSDGSVFQFDPNTRTFTTIDIPDNGPWQR